MKQTCANHSDIFGPSRTYSTRQYSSNNRPSMISAKYRQKEERRKVLKTSINKLMKIEDPETSLCRSVLINNTMIKLQDEAKYEKLQKQQLTNPLCYDKDNYRNTNSKLVRDHASNTDLIEKHQSSPATIVESYPNCKQTEETDVSATNEELFSALEESSSYSGSPSTNENVCPRTIESRSRVTSRKRSFSDMDDCNVQDVLSHFCVPPTPTMLTCIDDYEEVKAVDNSPKRIKNGEELSSNSRTSYQIDSALSNFGVDDLTNKNVTAKVSRFRHFSQTDSDSNSLGCAHAFLFSEFRNNNYQNLITSLES